MADNPVFTIYSEPLFSTQTQMTPTPTSANDSSQFEIGSELRFKLVQEEEESKPEEEYQGPFSLKRRVKKASQIVQDYLTTGCRQLDRLLKGGIPTFGITELVGESGCGKTQLCLQLTVMAQLPRMEWGLDSGVLYISTDEHLSTKRLNELISCFKKKYPSLPEAPMNHIFVEHILDLEPLLHCLDVKLDLLAKKSDKRIRLVILDTLTSIFRLESEDIKKRTTELRQLAQALHEFSMNHKAAIVVCNQVSANFQAGGNVAALGMSWKNLVTTRIRMSKSESNQRTMETIFSPHVPSIRIPFKIDANGLEALPVDPQDLLPLV